MKLPALPDNPPQELVDGLARLLDQDRWEDFVRACAERWRVEQVITRFGLSWPQYFKLTIHLARHIKAWPRDPDAAPRPAPPPAVPTRAPIDTLSRSLPPGDRE